MPDWKKFIAGKVVLAKKGNQPGKTNTNSRAFCTLSTVSTFAKVSCNLTWLQWLHH
jgi:hypothetical protein